MDYFFSKKLNSYSKDISSPEKSFDSCSRLSPYLSWGCISLKDRDILPIYIVEKELWRQKTYSDRQWQFCKESLIDLRNSLENIGQPLIIRTGKVIEIFDEISNKFNLKGIYSHQETGDFFTYKRDKEVRKWASMKKIIWKEYLQFSVFRGNLDRNNWSKKWKKNMEKKLLLEPSNINPIEIDTGAIPPDNFFCFKDDLCEGRLLSLIHI